MTTAYLSKTLDRRHTATTVLFYLFAVAAIFYWLVPMVGGLFPEHVWLAGGVAATVAAYGLSILICRWREMRLADMGLQITGSSAAHLLLGLLIGSGLMALHLVIVYGISGGFTFERVPEVGAKLALLSGLTFLFLSAMEEIAFRGFPLFALNRRYGLWTAQAVIAIVFIAYHVAGGQPFWNAVVGTGICSLLFGMAALATRGLAVPIGLHAAWNFGEWLIGEETQAGPWRVVVDEAALGRIQLIGPVSYVVVLSLATLGFYLLLRRQQLTEA